MCIRTNGKKLEFFFFDFPASIYTSCIAFLHSSLNFSLDTKQEIHCANRVVIMFRCFFVFCTCEKHRYYRARWIVCVGCCFCRQSVAARHRNPNARAPFTKCIRVCLCVVLALQCMYNAHVAGPRIYRRVINHYAMHRTPDH